MGLGKSRRQASGVEYCLPDRSLGWQKGLEGAVVGETMQFVEEGETSYCAAVLKGGQPCTVANDVEGFALDPVKAGGGGSDPWQTAIFHNRTDKSLVDCCPAR